MDPIAFELGPLVIRWYGIMMATSMMVGAWIGARLLHRAGRNGDLVWDGLVWIILAGIAGARLVYVVTNLGDYAPNPLEILMIWKGGLSFHGGIIAGGLATYFYFRSKGIRFLEVADCFAVGVSFGIILVRIGNFMNGDIAGYRWTGPWAMNFPFDQLHAGAAPGEVILRHPTEIYGLLVGVLTVLATYAVWKLVYAERRYPVGAAFMTFMIAYSLIRSVIEDPFRAVPLPLRVVDPAVSGFGLFTESQLASIGLIIIALILLTMLRGWERSAALATPHADLSHVPGLTRQQRRAMERQRQKKD